MNDQSYQLQSTYPMLYIGSICAALCAPKTMAGSNENTHELREAGLATTTHGVSQLVCYIKLDV